MNTHLPLGSILVGVDGSPHSLDATARAAGYAAQEARPLVIAHASHGTRTGGRQWSSDGTDRWMAGQRHLRRALEVAGRTSPGVRAVTMIQSSSAADLLLTLSEHAHLVVVGSRGLGRFGSLVFGSVSAAVASAAHAPVLVARASHHSRPAGSIVVGTDCTDSSAAAVDFAFRQASLWSRPLTVVHTVADRRVSRTRDIPLDRVPEHQGDFAHLSESIAGLRATYPDVEPDLRIVAGNPAACLVYMSRDAELVVMGGRPTRGRPGAAALLGSVSQSVVELAQCSVAVVHGDPGRPGQAHPRSATSEQAPEAFTAEGGFRCW